MLKKTIALIGLTLSLGANAAPLQFYDDFAAWSSDTESFFSNPFFGGGCGTAFNDFHSTPSPIRTSVWTNGEGGAFICNGSGELIDGWHYQGNLYNNDYTEWTVASLPNIGPPASLPSMDAITAFGLDLRIDSPSKSLTLDFYDYHTDDSNVSLLTSVELTVDQSGDEFFFGFISQSPIYSSFRLKSPDGRFAFDNLRLGTAGVSAFVPIPATAWLIGSALIGLGVARRKKV